MATKCRGDFKFFQFASVMRRQKKTAEDSIDTFVYYVGNGFGMSWYFAKRYDLIFRLLLLPNYVVYL